MRRLLLASVVALAGVAGLVLFHAPAAGVNICVGTTCAQPQPSFTVAPQP